MKKITNSFIAFLVLCLSACGGGDSAPAPLGSSSSSAPTDANILTWWHDHYEENATSAVADDKVRRSTQYDVTVANVGVNQPSKSFVYMTIPRGGKVKSYSDGDGAEFTSSAKQTMSWSSFLYKSDAWVQVNLKNGQSISNIDQVTIRPTHLNFEKEMLSANSIRIKVPYAEAGYRFSVEFASDLMSIRSTQLGGSGTLTENPKDALVHVEPRNALMIFAEPMLSNAQQAELVPTAASGSIYYPEQGTINLKNVTQDIIYFKPGVYNMGATYHANLNKNVKWVYLAPGAYVKGALEFNGSHPDYKLTGFGVLSGEKYVYAPLKNNNYAHSPGNCDGGCLRLLQFTAADISQTLTVHGITISEPPFNSFVVFGDVDDYQTKVSHYKQVGSWYWQTDGVESYEGGYVKDAFFHSNDDVIKMYHSNTTADNVVIWKGENGPAIQFGWASRNMSNILVKDVDVIHNRMYWKDQKSNICIINSTNMYSETPLDYDRISTDHTIKNVEFRNIRSEGKNLCAMRFTVLSNWENIHVNGLEIEDWNDLVTSAQVSTFSARKTMDEIPKDLSIGVGAAGLKIENYKVGGKLIQKSDESWKLNSYGRLSFDAALDDNWVAVGTGGNCTAQSIDFPQPENGFINTPIKLSGTASSGLPVTFKILGGEASVNGNLLTKSTQGLIAIAALAGNDSYCATQVVRLMKAYEIDAAPFDGRWIGASWQGWSPSKIPMAWDTNEKLYKANVSLTAGQHKMKFTNTDNWSEDDWGGVDGLSGTAIKTTGGKPDITFTIATAGNYLIRFDPYSLVYSITVN
jgi:hypothetical protein